MLHIPVTPELHKRVRRYAADEEKTNPEIVIAALEDYLPPQKRKAARR